MVIKLSSSSTDALLRVAEHSNVPVHLQAGDPLDIAGVVARRDYTFLLVDCGICRPLINNLLTGLLFLSQTAVNAEGVVWAKDRAHSFLTRLAALSSVYGRHTPGLRASIGGLLLRLCLGSLLLRLCLDGLWIELLVASNVGRQIGRPRLPVSDRRLHARVRRLQRRGGVLAYGYASSRQEGRADYAHAKSKTAQPVERDGAGRAPALSHYPAARSLNLRICFGCSYHGFASTDAGDQTGLSVAGFPRTPVDQARDRGSTGDRRPGGFRFS